MRLKIKNEEKASGISPTSSEIEEALEYLVEKEDSSDEIHRKNLNKKDQLVGRTKAEEVRKVAMESLGATKKRRADEKENVKKEPKRRRSAGSESVAFLLEKREKDTNARAADNELRKVQLELDKEDTMTCCKRCNNNSSSKCRHSQCCSNNRESSNSTRLNCF